MPAAFHRRTRSFRGAVRLWGWIENIRNASINKNSVNVPEQQSELNGTCGWSTSTGDDGCPLGSLFATISKRGASVAFLSFCAELESRSILVLFTSIFFAQSKSSEEDTHEAVPRRRSGNEGRRSTKGLGRIRWIVMSQFISRAKQCRAEDRGICTGCGKQFSSLRPRRIVLTLSSERV